MKNSFTISEYTLPILTVICVLLSGSVSAQSSDGGGTVASSPALTNPSATTSAADTAVAGTKMHDDPFIIGIDDVLAVNVWKEPEISRSVPVRSDGKISLPLVGEVRAAGETPKKLEGEIATKLHDYISEPEVTVIVQEIKSQRINILGQVARPGSYSLTTTMTVLDAIALAGGFRDFAKQKGIYVLREKADRSQLRLPFNYKEVIKGKNARQNIDLQPRDTVVVP